MKRRNDLWKWLAWHLPAKLVYYAALRLMGARWNGESWQVDQDVLQRQFNHWYEQAFYEKFLRWSTQNLSDGKYPLWKHGRGWLWLNGRCVFSVEWKPGDRYFCTLHLDWGGGDSDRDLGFCFGFPFVGFYYFRLDDFLPEWAIDGRWVDSTHFPGKRFKVGIKRKIGISISDGTIYFSLWENTHEWRKNQPKWWDFSFNPANFFLGRPTYSQIDGQPVEATVTLPEGSYPVTVTLFESRWKRPRWPWERKMIRAEVNCGERGIPSHAGKGDNGWDMDDDATFGMTCPETTVAGAVKRLEASILRDRERYGNPDRLIRAYWPELQDAG